MRKLVKPARVAVVIGVAAVLSGTTSSAQSLVTPEAGKIAFWRSQKDRCAIMTIDPSGIAPCFASNAFTSATVS